MKYSKQRIIVILALLSLPASVYAAAQKCGEHVSLAKLIANPDAYHGKALRIAAHVTIEFENMTACPSEINTQMPHCLWLNIDDGPFKTDQDYARYQSKRLIWERFNHHSVVIHATFDKIEKGHFSMWPGGLKTVTAVTGKQGGWSFVTNTSVPRTKCQGP